MASRIIFYVKPYIVPVGDLQCQRIVLQIVFSDENGKPVGRSVFGRFTGLGFFLLLSFNFAALFDIPLFGQFSAYLRKFGNRARVFNGTADGFEVLDIGKRFRYLFGKHFFRGLRFLVKFVIPLSVRGGR